MLQNEIQIDQQFTVSMDHFNWFKKILLTLNFLVNQRLIQNMFISKIYTYSMRLRRNLAKKKFYIDVAKKEQKDVSSG